MVNEPVDRKILNDKVRDYLRANPKLITSNYSQTAIKFGITKERCRHIARDLKRKMADGQDEIVIISEPQTYQPSEHTISTKVISNDMGTIKSEVESTFEPKNDLELAELHHIDLDKYRISTYWSKLKSNGKFTSSVLCTLIKGISPEEYQKNFIEYLEDYIPVSEPIKNVHKSTKSKGALLLPKQDAHYNKYDINGENDIEKRFDIIEQSIVKMLSKAVLCNHLDEIIYIVGSDQFNSEWTSLTTKGTPQQNILNYQDAFSAICDHEIKVITTLLSHSDHVSIVFIPGNHDEFVGWHLINWLKCYFRNAKNISLDSSILNTKYIQYHNTAIMLNHGDDMKPKDLAGKFPIDFKANWSSCKHYYIFTGDKHHELSLDIHGIKFYQVPQLSSAKSKWDDKKGFVSSAEMTGFLITSTNGMSDIYKDILN